MKTKSKISDLVISIGTIIFGIVICILAGNLPSAKLGLGADGFPRVIGIAFMVVGVSYLVVTLRHGIDFSNVKISLKPYLPSILLMVIALIYVSLLTTIGFPILTPILMLCTMFCFGYRKYVQGIIISIVFSTVVYFLFTKVFLIFLPAGILS